MPRFAFAVPFLPHKQDEWRATAGEIPVRRATEHRQHLLERGIFKERWWMQTGAGTPPLSLVLWDCDDLDRVGLSRIGTGNRHDDWMAEQVVGQIHGLDPVGAALPHVHLLSGTTTMATATAGSQTMFALPIPAEGIDAVRSLVERIEHGDLSRAHGQFLADASIREEWIWLQEPTSNCPALLLIHWIGDDLDDAWQRLTYVRDDPYARVLHEALFTRLIGIGPEQVAHWRIEQLLVMHVRRSDSFAPSHRRVGQKFVGAARTGGWPAVQRLMGDNVVLLAEDGTRYLGPPAVVDALRRAMDAASDGQRERPDVADLLVGTSHVQALLEWPDGTTMPLLIGFDEGRVVALHVQPLMSRRDRLVAD